MGRPVTYKPEIAEKICDLLASGLGLNTICKREGFPPESTVRRWVQDDREGFAAKYTRAREIQAHVLADEIIAIADNGSNDWMESNDPENPGYRVNGEHIQRSRMRFDARRWYISKVLPKVYGDKLEVSADVSVSVVSDLDRLRQAAIRGEAINPALPAPGQAED